MKKNTQNNPRKGAATIEFVFALPVLMLLMVSLAWLGFSMLGQAEVSVIARHQAWQKRNENPNANAFVFTTHPGYGRENDFALGESEKEVNVSRLFQAIPNPDATALILSGSWDHRAMGLDDLPNWSAYTKAVVNAKTGDMQNLLGGMDNLRNILKDVGKDFLKSQLTPLSGLAKGRSTESDVDQLKTDEELSKESRKRELLERQIILEEEITSLEKTKRKQSGFLNPTQTRKLFRLTSEQSDVKLNLEMVR